MQRIKNTYTTLFLLAASFLFSRNALAAPSDSFSFDFKLENPLQADTLIELLEAVVGILARIGIPLIAMMIIYGGFQMVTATGNEEKLTKAKGTIMYAMLGGAILLGAWIIVSAIKGTIDVIDSEVGTP